MDGGRARSRARPLWESTDAASHGVGHRYRAGSARLGAIRRGYAKTAAYFVTRVYSRGPVYRTAGSARRLPRLGLDDVTDGRQPVSPARAGCADSETPGCAGSQGTTRLSLLDGGRGRPCAERAGCLGPLACAGIQADGWPRPSSARQRLVPAICARPSASRLRTAAAMLGLLFRLRDPETSSAKPCPGARARPA